MVKTTTTTIVETERKVGIINPSSSHTLIFTYGTLKHGFSNHELLDMMSTGDASFLGIYRTSVKLPLVCGPYRVPFLLNLPGSGDHHVHGELYAVSPKALSRMDELEGTTLGHYERLPLKVVPHHQQQEYPEDEVVVAEAYYAAKSYTLEMWKRNGEKGYSCYTKKEAQGYVYRKDRPPNLSFLDHIHLFLHPPPRPASSPTTHPVQHHHQLLLSLP